MKVRTHPHPTTPINAFDPDQTTVDHVIWKKPSQPRRRKATPNAEEELVNRIFREGNGKGLIKFCRELAVILIRRYMVENDAGELRAKLMASIVATLRCTKQQAECLIDLSLELIHAKVHGKYRRSEVELSYLIATATGAVNDVSAN